MIVRRVVRPSVRPGRVAPPGAERGLQITLRKPLHT